MIYSEAEARSLVIRAGLELCEHKLIARTWGNISARISESEFIITPSGRAYQDLTPDQLVKVNISDCSYEGDVKPSSEKGLHAAAYGIRPDCGFIIHTHQFYASALCVSGQDFPFSPCSGYGLPGTGKLKDAVAKCIEANPGFNAFLMKSHGAVCLGGCYEDAFNEAYTLEDRCKAEFHSKVSLDDIPYDEALPTIDGFGSVVCNTSNFVVKCSLTHRRIPALIDDYAQLVGPACKCADIFSVPALKGRNALLIKGKGAYCVSEAYDDAEAVSMILQKNCAALLYSPDARPLSIIDSLLQRIVYLNKYSKQKDCK